MSKIKTFILGSIDEISNKVVWLPYTELQSSSVLVLVVSFVFALIVGTVDIAFKNIVTWFYSAF